MARLTLFFATLFCLLLILSPLLDVVAQVDDSSNQSDYSSPTTVILIVLISLFFAAGFVSIYLKHYATCLGFHQLNARVDGGPRRRRDPTPGIDPALIASFPIFLFSQVKLHRIGNAPLECAVCLNEFSEDHERLRLLPGCSHVFHPDCIDPWLANHITCPICRATLPQHQSSVTLFDHPPDDLELWIDHPLTSPPLSHDNNSNNGEGHVIIPVIRPSPDVQANIINMINCPTTMLDKGKGDRLRKLTRSHSTGHSLREEGDRFTLRLPQELLRNKLELGAPYADDNNINFNKGEALPAALISPRVGYRARSVGCTGMTIKPECWRFSVSPPFIISQRGAGTGLTRSPGSKSDQDGPTDMMQECGSTTTDLSGVTSPKRLGLFKSIKSPLKREAAPSDDIGEHS